MMNAGSVRGGKSKFIQIAMYRASPNELKLVIEKEGSFSIEYLDNFIYDLNDEEHIKDRANFIAKSFRAVIEPLVASHFGQGIIEEIFNRHKAMILESIHEFEKMEFFNVVSMTKK